jgi:hypothetical protein
VILWLARKDEATEGNVWVKLAQRRFGPRQPVSFTAGAMSPESAPIEDAEYDVEVTLPDKSTRKVNLVREGDHVSGAFDATQTAGDYTIMVTARHGGATLGTAKSRFLVYEQDLELDNAVADPSLLASLSAMTKDVGGQSLAPEELPDLLAQLRAKPLDLEVEAQVKHAPWDTWPFFLLFVAVISGEWYLRKKWGLV